MKYGRLIIGFVAVLTALWIILGEQMSGASADAVVNAPVVTIRAPVSGNLQMVARPLGSRVSAGEVLASIQDPMVDRVRLNDLLMEVRLEAAAEAQIASLLSEIRALGQRSLERDKEIALLTSRLTEAQERRAAVQERADRERIRVNGLTGGDLQAPVGGLFWEVLEADGVNVQRGDPLLRLVDCQAILVTVSVTERIYNTLTVGQAATFRLGGTSDVLDATISRLAGSGAATIYRNLAVAPGPRQLERYDVTLIVPALQAGQEGCIIGRTGRAFFEDRPLDWLRGIFC